MKKPEIWAHRGASGYCPENTLPAFEKAVEMGAQGLSLIHISEPTRPEANSYDVICL